MESGEKEKTRWSVFHLHLQEASSHAAWLQTPKDFAAYSWVATKERWSDLLLSIFKQKADIEALISSPNVTYVRTNQKQAERGKTLYSLC